MVGPAHPGEISGGNEEEEENVLQGRGRGTVSGRVSPRGQGRNLARKETEWGKGSVVKAPERRQ